MNLLQSDPVERAHLSAVLGVARVAAPDSTQHHVVIETTRGAVRLTERAATYLRGRLDDVLRHPSGLK